MTHHYGKLMIRVTCDECPRCIDFNYVAQGGTALVLLLRAEYPDWDFLYWNTVKKTLNALCPECLNLWNVKTGL